MLDNLITYQFVMLQLDFMHRPSISIEKNHVFNVSGDEHSNSFDDRGDEWQPFDFKKYDVGNNGGISSSSSSGIKLIQWNNLFREVNKDEVVEETEIRSVIYSYLKLSQIYKTTR